MQVLACVCLQPLGATEDSIECGELAAFCVHPSYRGSGRGDSLLDYVEQRARDKGIRRLVRIPHIHPLWDSCSDVQEFPASKAGRQALTCFI